jgi:hypothetical protein
MNTIRIILLMILLLPIGTPCYFLIADENPAMNNQQCPQDKIRQFAQKLEVFPVDIIASNPQGPIIAQYSSLRWWGERHEISFEQYFIFYKFKKYIQDITLEDFVKIVDFIDEASPKEKAIILTSIFIFEWLHRIRPDRYYRPDRNLPWLLPCHKTYLFISGEQWNNWNSLLKKFSQDKTVAFASIKKDNILLQKSWENDRERVKEKLKELGILQKIKIDHTLQFFDDGSYENARKNLSPSDQILSDAIYEYLAIPYRQPLFTGTGPQNGNSSATPKTLGDIATQLLMSRISYEGKNNVKE